MEMMVDARSLPLFTRLRVRVMGSAHFHKLDGLEYLYGRCKFHGYYLQYARGYEGKVSCPECHDLRSGDGPQPETAPNPKRVI